MSIEQREGERESNQFSIVFLDILLLRSSTNRSYSMSLAERDQLILTIIFSIVAFVFLLLIISLLLCRLIRSSQTRSKHRLEQSFEHARVHPPPSISIYPRTQYQRSQKYPSKNKFNHQSKTRKKRANTNDSVISFSFNPPHLINQNVKHLEKFYQNESTLTANSWFYEQTLAKKIW